MEEYVVKWLRPSDKTLVDISARVGAISTTDDLDSFSVRMQLDIQQSVVDYYHQPIGISCGDRITLYKDGNLVIDGQVNTVSGDYRTKQTLTVYDDGVVLTKNDLIIQFNGVSASKAISQLCDRLGIPAGEMPNMATTITHVYHESVSNILSSILDAVAAETGKRYFVRVRGGKLCVLERGGSKVTAIYKPAGNLSPANIALNVASPTVNRSIEDLRNAVTIYSDQDASARIYAEASDAASIERFGKRMKVDTYSDKDGATASQKARTLLSDLNTEKEEISVKTFGADNVTSGVLLDFNTAEFSGTFLVQAVSKQYAHPHTMDLTLRRWNA